MPGRIACVSDRHFREPGFPPDPQNQVRPQRSGGRSLTMLVELRVRNLGVIDDLTLLLGPGMTAITGETGAGKTLVVEAIELLVGGRAEGFLVRPGASEATVDGRFVTGGVDGDDPDQEVVISRVVPADGRSRAYLDGRM